MIIEQMKIDGPKNLFLVHISIKNDSPHSIDHVCDFLRTIPGHAVVRVPNGQPGPSNPLPKITIFNADNPVLMSAVEKILKDSKPGAMIPLTAEEMKAWVNSQATDWAQI